MHAREPASFWRENVVAVVTLLRVLARMSKWRKQVIYPDQMLVVLSFCDWERVTSFTKGNSANFSSQKWYNEAFQGVYILRIRKKDFKSNLVFVVVLVLESKGL